VVAHVPLPAGTGMWRDGRYPTLSIDGGLFLAHLRLATASLSPKAHALLEHLRRQPAGSKAVVFSQLKEALLHVGGVLTANGMGNATIAPGSSAEDRQQAVHEFATDPECRVLLLHAGVAAAGLTLTMAHHAYLLEPFLTLGDELQAMNRCHRIGQEHEVRTVTFYVRGTVEERLLAYRLRSEGPQDAAVAGAAALSSLDNAAAGGESQRLDKLAFLFGLSDAADFT